MLVRSIKQGIHRMSGEWQLTVLIYLLNLVPAVLFALPVYAALTKSVGSTGFGMDLAGGFDLVLWTDIMEELGPAAAALAVQLLWIAPLYVVWKTAAYAGLIYALSMGGRSFWTGVGRYTLRALLLAIPFLLMTLAAFVLAVAAIFTLSLVWKGEVAVFWLYLVFLPMLMLGGLAIVAWMHDFARIGLVLEDRRVRDAWGIGTRWPRRYGQSMWLFAGWLAVVILLTFAPTLLDLRVSGSTGIGIWALFIGQQFFLFLRAAATVGWVSSETTFFQEVRDRERPLIAAEAAGIA